MKKMAIFVLMFLVCSVASGQVEWIDKINLPFEAQGVFDHNTGQLSFVCTPDADSAVGVFVLSGSYVEDRHWDNIVIGPKVNFRLDAAYEAILSTVMPWITVPDDIPFELYGFGGFGWEIGGDHNILGIIGTEARLMPGRRVQPTMCVEWVQPENSSEMQSLTLFLFGTVIHLGNQ